jgi:hypothetical protein
VARVPEIEDADFPHPLQRFFEGLRRIKVERAAARGPGKGAAKRRAVITMVHNEPVFFPIWLRYYSRFFAAEDIHVFDNDTTDGSLDGGGFVRLPASHSEVDHEWMVQTIRDRQHELLAGDYDVVLVTDVDEIVCPVPGAGTLGDYIDAFEEEFVNAIGYELIHIADEEPPIDLMRPILEQRRHWFADDVYDKPALATAPMEWKPGFHERIDAANNFDPDLRLIHLHRMDYELCRERHRLRSVRRWRSRDVDEGWAVHNLITKRRAFRRWFYFETGYESYGIEMHIQRIPPEWRGLF